MSGISGISTGYGRLSYYPALGNSPKISSVQKPQEAPVTPVRKVSPVSRQMATPAEQGLTYTGPQAVENYREGADPVEMAVRGRIQYLSEEELSKSQTKKSGNAQEIMEEAECQTCKERKYQDGSNDPGVSMKTPTNVSKEAAASAVRGHEMEHVVRERAKADREDRKVVSQSVTYHTAICPECGDVYVSGGTTRTATKADPASEAQKALAEKQKMRTPFDIVA